MLALAAVLSLFAISPEPTPVAIPTDPVLVGAGDIVDCIDRVGSIKTAALIDKIPGMVFTLGDNVYESGSIEDFAQCYEPTWGRFRNRTRPAPGNHDYRMRGARGYFQYFGPAAGDPARGYYGYDIGAWHVIVLNSNCKEIGGCGAASAEAAWLKQDLASHPALCTVAMYHHPRFSSASHGDITWMDDLWKILAAGGVDVVLAGHDHVYERFAPLDAAGRPDADHGIRSFIVGTGGKSHYKFDKALHPASEAHNADTFGVLKLTLHPDSYDWEFLPVAGGSFHDSGSGRCH